MSLPFSLSLSVSHPLSVVYLSVCLSVCLSVRLPPPPAALTGVSAFALQEKEAGFFDASYNEVFDMLSKNLFTKFTSTTELQAIAAQVR
jgi:hypothetical protein